MRAALILALSALVTGGACLAASGPLPADVAVTLALQSVFGASPTWAQWLTDTGKPPFVAVTVMAGAGLVWLGAGWRAAVAVPIAFGLGWLIDKALRAMIFAPRPAADLVAVAHGSSSSGLPSTFGLVYGTVFGAVLLTRTEGWRNGLLKGIGVLMILSGTAARVVLGGHWTSQMLASLLLGLLAAMAAIALSRLAQSRIRPRRPAINASRINNRET